MKRPTPEHVKAKLVVLRRWANALRGYYGVPVYLCGSALSGSNPNPRDWDIRLTLSEEQWRKRFGDPWKWEEEGGSGKWTDIRWKWSDECVKNSEQGYRRTGLNIDFQIYPAAHARQYAHRPKLRLDTRKGR